MCQISQEVFARTKKNTAKTPVATVTEKQELTCEKAITLDKPVVVMYSADYCFYCKQFKPVFYHLSYNLSNEYNFVIYDITKKHQQTICNDVDLNGIPTLYIINPKTKQHYLISERYYSNPVLLKNKLLEYYKNLK